MTRKKSPDVHKSKRRDTGAAKPERTQTTVYFLPEVKKRLAIYCAEHNAEMSTVVNEAVTRFLDRA
jgi:hypothetical protein